MATFEGGELPPRRIVHGTPITPARLLDQLKEGSFCVSFAEPRQIEECIELVGDHSILVLDNGAYSHWRNGKGEIDREDYWDWANDIQSRCEQAVAVIPDVIEGDEEDNLLECSWAVREGLAEFPERCMAVWHTNESEDLLRRYFRLFNFVGIGSSGAFDAVSNPKAYLELMEAVGDVWKAISAVYHRTSWVHLMRGLQHLSKVTWAESADSCNLARNHHKYSGVPEHVRQMSEGLARKVRAGEVSRIKQLEFDW